ncbi:DedA family protein [Pseudonocardia asaccharolytica]|uniref:Membrane protein n=1 Tax=Pseudonocardia asaccharolytica DSM 44247 = NBRC 16224 TaxID=1123024 RepID=A0A511CWC7_9PSEU|nr:VTT domain-containing protein [Pseudonocardia asaccharolytica]GEL16777.1 membrane protein [Pseudonocardia asaccharolytica DSM 44247 = NBRC 16224]
MELIAAFDAVLHSVWLLPVLVVLIALDGPFPVLPSETLLMSASAAAFGIGDMPGVVGLFLTALIGSAIGDLAVFGLGRSSKRVVSRRIEDEYAFPRWVQRNLFRRPEIVLIGARFVPGGRLVSTAASGRVQLPLRRFVPGSLASSALWSGYMLVVGLLWGPFVAGNALLCIAAGIVMALLTAGVFALARRLWPGRGREADADRDNEPAFAG